MKIKYMIYLQYQKYCFFLKLKPTEQKTRDDNKCRKQMDGWMINSRFKKTGVSAQQRGSRRTSGPWRGRSDVLQTFEVGVEGGKSRR